MVAPLVAHAIVIVAFTVKGLLVAEITGSLTCGVIISTLVAVWRADRERVRDLV